MRESDSKLTATSSAQGKLRTQGHLLSLGQKHASKGEVVDSLAPDYGEDCLNYPEHDSDGLWHCIYTYLGNLDGLVARGCADKFPYGAWVGDRCLWDFWDLLVNPTYWEAEGLCFSFLVPAPRG